MARHRESNLSNFIFCICFQNPTLSCLCFSLLCLCYVCVCLSRCCLFLHYVSCLCLLFCVPSMGACACSGTRPAKRALDPIRRKPKTASLIRRCKTPFALRRPATVNAPAAPSSSAAEAKIALATSWARRRLSQNNQFDDCHCERVSASEIFGVCVKILTVFLLFAA